VVCPGEQTVPVITAKRKKNNYWWIYMDIEIWIAEQKLMYAKACPFCFGMGMLENNVYCSPCEGSGFYKTKKKICNCPYCKGLSWEEVARREYDRNIRAEAASAK
jgi:hypothetical protein